MKICVSLLGITLSLDMKRKSVQVTSTSLPNVMNATYLLSNQLSFDNFGTEIRIYKSPKNINYDSGYISDFNGNLSFTSTNCTYLPTIYIRNETCQVPKNPIPVNVYLDESYPKTPIDTILTSVSNLFRNQFNNVTFSWTSIPNKMSFCKGTDDIKKIYDRFMNHTMTQKSSINVLFMNCTLNTKDVNGIAGLGGYNVKNNGVVIRSNKNMIGTMAHELGHIFNMTHDEKGIMQSAGSRTINGIRQFSSKSVNELCRFLYMRK